MEVTWRNARVQAVSDALAADEQWLHRTVNRGTLNETRALKQLARWPALEASSATGPGPPAGNAIQEVAGHARG